MQSDFKYRIRFNDKLMDKVLLPGEDLDQELLWWERAHPNETVEIVRINPSKQQTVTGEG